MPFISGFAADGTIKVSFAGTGTSTALTGLKWIPDSPITMKIVVSSTYSTTQSKTATDEFVLHMSDGTGSGPAGDTTTCG